MDLNPVESRGLRENLLGPHCSIRKVTAWLAVMGLAHRPVPKTNGIQLGEMITWLWLVDKLKRANIWYFYLGRGGTTTRTIRCLRIIIQVYVANAGRRAKHFLPFPFVLMQFPLFLQCTDAHTYRQTSFALNRRSRLLKFDSILTVPYCIFVIFDDESIL